jgi:hypothetical protein
MGNWIRARVRVGNDKCIQNSGNMRIGTVLCRFVFDDCLWVIFKVPDLVGASYKYFLNSEFASLRIVI